MDLMFYVVADAILLILASFGLGYYFLRDILKEKKKKRKL